ncbi:MULTISPECIES: GntR family transcriptional regulator [Caloramator]|uniref:GntR family transcriptional regulator n=1 Tax=Caloramator proteoclasticus DSM 10124 TaxID=1121262 RepID=A0A1M4XV01_9CLOT|nr:MULTISPECIES: GntR family transcriptional regulator [Caloramator]SHE97113.1 GntR family transcriptional regulator [Caloramator proteoclasticus DSM 10124]
MFELDVRSRVPIYEQLFEKIKELIIKGLLKEHEQLPSVRALSNDLTINPNTIQKAYRELENQGYIYSIPGKGSFVAPLKDRDINKEKIEKILEEVKKLMLEGLYLGMDREDFIKVLEDAIKIKEVR